MAYVCTCSTARFSSGSFGASLRAGALRCAQSESGQGVIFYYYSGVANHRSFPAVVSTFNVISLISLINHQTLKR